MVVMEERVHASVCQCVYVRVCVCVGGWMCVCVCVWEMKKKRQKSKEERSCQSELVISSVEVCPCCPSTLSARTYGSRISRPRAYRHFYHSNTDLHRSPRSAVNPPLSCFS